MSKTRGHQSDAVEFTQKSEIGEFRQSKRVAASVPYQDLP